MQTTRSAAANTWEVFKDLMRLSKGSELEDRAPEARKPINRKNKVVANTSRGPVGQWQMSGIHKEEAHKQEEERADGTQVNKGNLNPRSTVKPRTV